MNIEIKPKALTILEGRLKKLGSTLTIINSVEINSQVAARTDLNAIADPLQRINTRLNVARARIDLDNLAKYSPGAIATIQERMQHIQQQIDDQSAKSTQAEQAFRKMEQRHQLGLIDKGDLEAAQEDFNQFISAPAPLIPKKPGQGYKIYRLLLDDQYVQILL